MHVVINLIFVPFVITVIFTFARSLFLFVTIVVNAYVSVTHITH